MAKEYMHFQGKGSWFKHLFQLDEEYQRWHVTLHFDTPSLDKFRSLSTKTQLKKDDDGYYAKLSRPRKKIMRGKEVIFDPPLITNKDGQPLPKETIVGNGSDITVTCEIYSYSPPGSKERKQAIRLESVRIDNLVPFNPDKDYPEAQKEAAERLLSAPEPLF